MSTGGRYRARTKEQSTNYPFRNKIKIGGIEMDGKSVYVRSSGMLAQVGWLKKIASRTQSYNS